MIRRGSSRRMFREASSWGSIRPRPAGAVENSGNVPKDGEIDIDRNRLRSSIEMKIPKYLYKIQLPFHSSRILDSPLRRTWLFSISMMRFS